MSAIWKKALADVTRRKGRSLLVMLGIFIGVFGLVGINFTEDTIFAALAFTLNGNTPDFTMTVSKLDPTVLPTLQSTANVKQVQYQTSWQTQWHVSQAPGIFPMSIDSFPDLAHIPITPFQLLSGRLPNVGEIALEYGDLSLQSFNVGDTVMVDGAQGKIPLRVVGTVRTPGVDPAAHDAAVAYMSDAGLQQLAGAATGAPPGANQLRYHIGFTVQQVAQENATATHVQQILHAAQIQVLSLDFPGHIDPAAIDAIHSVFTLLRILAILAVVMSGFLILNTVMALLAEQTAIIGALKALGGTRWAILRGYLVSVVLYSILGTLPAIALGIGGGYLLASGLAPTIPLAVGPFELTPEVIPLGLAVGFGVPILAALAPLLNGTRITVREALSAYGVSAGGSGQVAWLSQRVARAPQTFWLGLSGAFRKPWRAALTLLTLIVAGSCFLTVQTATTSVSATVASVYGHWDADVEVQMGPTTLSQAQSQLASVPNIQRIERYGEGGTLTPWGRLEIWGTDADTQIYRYQLTSGRWLQPGDTNVILLSDDAAAKSGLKVGDMFTVTNRGGTFAWLIIGTVSQATTNIGGLGAAVTDTDDLYRLDGYEQTGQTGLAPELMIRAQDRSDAAVSQLTTAVNTVLDSTATMAVTTPDGKTLADYAFVTTVAREAQRHEQSWYILYLLLYIVALIVGVVGILGLANALIASVLERQREIGMLRALGATGNRVAQVFWTEGLALGGIAWLVSAVLGLPLAYVFVQQLRQGILPTMFVVDATAFIVMLIAICAIASLASMLPSARASRMRIADILRYE